MHHPLSGGEYLISSQNEVGKKINFLIQEMLREINTIGSKSNDFALQKNVIDLADVYMFTKPINARALVTIFDNQLKGEMEIVNASLKNYQRLQEQFQNEDSNVTSEMLQTAKDKYETDKKILNTLLIICTYIQYMCMYSACSIYSI